MAKQPSSLHSKRKTFIAPMVKINKFAVHDVITTSGDESTSGINNGSNDFDKKHTISDSEDIL